LGEELESVKDHGLLLEGINFYQYRTQTCIINQNVSVLI
jgi:hypothetical protein